MENANYKIKCSSRVQNMGIKVYMIKPFFGQEKEKKPAPMGGGFGFRKYEAGRSMSQAEGYDSDPAEA